MRNTCADCKFWAIDPNNLRQGVCRKDPPKTFAVLQGQGYAFVTMFPATKAEEWCGQFEGKLLTGNFAGAGQQ